MAELLTQLTNKTRVECEEAHRQKVAALNGLAGLLIIKEEVGILPKMQQHHGVLMVLNVNQKVTSVEQHFSFFRSKQYGCSTQWNLIIHYFYKTDLPGR